MSLLIAPLEALVDPRLTDPERRVLLSLYSFRNKNADTVWPSIEAIAERSNIADKTRISKITTSLSKKGWLTKKRRGFTGGNSYSLTVPGTTVEEKDEALSGLEALLAEPVNSGRKSEKLYLATDGENYKIGITTMPLTKRLGSLQTGSAKPLEMVCCAECEGAGVVEKAVLSKFQEQVVSGEWMALTDEQVVSLVYFLKEEGLELHTKLDWYANLDHSTNSNLDQNANSNLDSAAKCNEQQSEQQKEHKNIKPPKSKFSDEDMECANWLFQKLKEFIPDCRDANLPGWAEHIRKMRELDNRDYKEICSIWLWCRRDGFEAANVQSPDKLRKRYDQLKVKMRNTGAASISAGQRASETTRDSSIESQLLDRSWANGG